MVTHTLWNEFFSFQPRRAVDSCTVSRGQVRGGVRARASMSPATRRQVLSKDAENRAATRVTPIPAAEQVYSSTKHE